MTASDPIGSLLFLARAAADAGEDWRARLRFEWAPDAVRSQPASLRHALLERGVTDEDLEDLSAAVVRAVEEELDEAGVD